MPRTKTTKELLRAAKELIATEDRWTTGYLEDAHGCRRCALGAVYTAAGYPCRVRDANGELLERNFAPDPEKEPDAHAAIQALVDASPLDRDDVDMTESVWLINDRLGFEAVHRMFDRAIEAAA